MAMSSSQRAALHSHPSQGRKVLSPQSFSSASNTAPHLLKSHHLRTLSPSPTVFRSSPTLSRYCIYVLSSSIRLLQQNHIECVALTTTTFFLTVLEAGRSKIQLPAVVGSGEDFSLACRCPHHVRPASLHGRRREGSGLPRLIRALITSSGLHPYDLIET